MSLALIVLGDSRGRGVSEYIRQNIPQLAVFDRVSPGANYNTLLSKVRPDVERLRKYYKKIIVLLLAGICNFTTKKLKKEIVYYRQGKLEVAKCSLDEFWQFSIENEIHLITSTIIPVELQKANRLIKNRDYSEQQNQLNRDIDEINKYILGNIEVGSVINLYKLATKISIKRFGKYRQKRRKFRKLNKNLLIDGVHPSYSLKTKINEKIAEFTTKYIN